MDQLLLDKIDQILILFFLLIDFAFLTFGNKIFFLLKNYFIKKFPKIELSVIFHH